MFMSNLQALGLPTYTTTLFSAATKQVSENLAVADGAMEVMRLWRFPGICRPSVVPRMYSIASPAVVTQKRQTFFKSRARLASYGNFHALRDCQPWRRRLLGVFVAAEP